jgi:hypothetical protein
MVGLLLSRGAATIYKNAYGNTPHKVSPRMSPRMSSGMRMNPAQALDPVVPPSNIPCLTHLPAGGDRGAGRSVDQAG